MTGDVYCSNAEDSCSVSWHGDDYNLSKLYHANMLLSFICVSDCLSSAYNMVAGIELLWSRLVRGSSWFFSSVNPRIVYNVY